MFKKLVTGVYGLGSKNRNEPELRVRENGFDIVRAGQVAAAIELRTIKEIAAFKRDLGTTDLVCFEIVVFRDAQSLIYEMNEEMRGFNELVSSLEQLRGFMSNWRELVIKPAFAPQRTTIFRAFGEKSP